MQAPSYGNFVLPAMLLAGAIVLGGAWLVAPSLIAFILFFVVFGLSLHLSKFLALWVLGAWVLGHLSVWLYQVIHDKILYKRNMKRHEDYMRIRKIFYFDSAACGETYDALKVREQDWLEGYGSGENIPYSPIKCDIEDE